METSTSDRPPSYIPRDSLDPDDVSLHSVAPSYTSSLPPTYTAPTAVAAAAAAAVAAPRHAYTSLIPSTCSPPASHHAYNVASWPSLSNHSQSRAYLNVAARRAQRAQEAEREEEVRRALRISTQFFSGEGGSSSGAPAAGMDSEDREAALNMEGRAWDFFTTQISDWEQREVSWRSFQERVGAGSAQRKKKKKAGRWGLYGRLG
jgi:hypothetical protein